MFKKQNLEEKIKIAQNSYYNGISIIDDDEYDALLYELSILDPSNVLLNKIGAEANSTEWNKEKHIFPLGSLNKVNYPDEMKKWISDNLNNKEVLVSEKLDGLSLGCQYEDGKLIKAVLRGNGTEGEDIFNNVIKMIGIIKNIPNFDGVIRGEIILTKTNHLQHFSDYSNPRNAASGLSRDLKGDSCKYLTFIAYDVLSDFSQFSTEEEKMKFLQKNNFVVPNFKLCKNVSDVNDLWKKYQDSIRSSLDYEIDGLVVCCNDIDFQKSLGETNLKSKGKMAFKFENQFVKTTINKIEWVTGNSGRVTPLCWFDKVNLLGSNIEKASIYNIDYVLKLQLDVGAEVLVCKANEIIPRVEKVIKSTGTITKIISECPSCNSSLDLIGKHLQCLNTINCPAQRYGRLANWIKEINVLEWGESVLTKLLDSGKVNTIVDLYKLSVKDIAELDRMGEKSAKKCYNILHADKNIPLDIFLGGLSIPYIGGSTIRAIMNAGCDTIEKFGQLKAENFEQVAGVGPVKAKLLADGLVNNQALILELLNYVTIKSKVVGKLTGTKIAITGSTKTKRADLEKMIAEAGGEYKSSVGKTCTHLVIEDINSASSKAVSARKLGIKLLTENEFLGLL